MIGRRPVLTALCLVLIAAACSSGPSQQLVDDGPGSYGSGVSLDIEGGPTSRPQASSGPGSRPSSVGAPVAGHPTPADFGGGFTPDLSRRIRDDGMVGDSAFFFLNRKTPKLIVEIDQMEGLELQSETIQLLRARLESVVDKPDGIEFVVSTIPREGRAEWDSRSIGENQRKNRDHHSSADAAVIYIGVLEGEPKGGGFIGVAYEAGSCAVMLEYIRDAAATPLVPAELIERSTTIHEVGHLLSLVGIGYESPRPHQDPENGNHSNNQDSVMYWAVDNVGVAGLLQGRTAPPTDFDADDRADLEDVKNGKLG